MPRTEPIRVYLKDSYFSAYPSSVDRVIETELPASLQGLKEKISRHDPTVPIEQISAVSEALIVLAHLGERFATTTQEDLR